MQTVGAFLDAIASIDRETFCSQNPSPFLITVETALDALMGGSAEGSSAATVAQDPAKLRRASIEARDGQCYAIAKREGANTETEILLGRSRDNDVSMTDAEVSKHHARIVVTKQGYELVDQGSTNGTFVNEKQLEKGKRVLLQPYDSIRFGRAAKMQFLDAGSLYDYLTILQKYSVG